jgi:protein-tyrosine phosphatase
MAEGLLSKMLQDRGCYNVNVKSAGLSALVGEAPHINAQKLMRSRGIDIATCRAHQLEPDLLYWADLVLVMEAEQKKYIETISPAVKGRVCRIGEWGDFDIPDPYGFPEEAFERALELIDQGIIDWLPRLLE